MVNKYRRIEVNAFHRQVTIVSGEWPSIAGVAAPLHEEDAVSLKEANACESVEPASPEGQKILVEAVRSLERRLSPEALETIRSGRTIFVPRDRNQKRFRRWLQSICQFLRPRTFRFARKEK